MRPKTLRPKSVLPPPIDIQTRSARDDNTGKESYWSEFQISLTDGDAANCRVLISSRQSAPARSKNVKWKHRMRSTATAATPHSNLLTRSDSPVPIDTPG